MLILGIETSGHQGSIALTQNGVTLAFQPLKDLRRRHAQTLLLEIKNLLVEHKLRPGDCQRIAVSRGPGSFTGLRVGIVCAKTFAYATGCELIAVDTLQAIAENAAAKISDLSVVENAQRGDFFVGHYLRDSGAFFQRQQTISINNAHDWLQAQSTGSHVTGPGLAAIQAENLNSELVYLPTESWQAQADVVCQIGQRSTPLTKDEVWGLEPYYLRKSAAEEKWEARQAEG